MKWYSLALLLVNNAFSCPILVAQVLFSSKQAVPETLRISHFDKSIRFIKPINIVLKPAEKKPHSPTPVVAPSNSKEQSSSRLAGTANRWRNVPSIPPLRVLSRKQYRISSFFGVRCHPITGQRHLHNGIDFSQPDGTPVYATADGYVRHVGLKPDGLGLSVRIEHPSGYITTYGHLSRYVVQPGQWIRQGQQIGRIGQTGTATGPHLHYIVQFKGQNVDPMRFCFLTIVK